MKNIRVAYYHLSAYPELEKKYPHNSEHNLKSFNNIVKDIMKAGYNLQILQGTETILIFIDKNNFKQR